MISTGILVKIFQQMVMVFFWTKNRNGIDFYYLQNTITCKFMSPFHSTKTFENLATAANGTEISRNVNHSNSRFSGSKVEIMERKLPGINFRKLGIPCEVALFLEILLLHSLLEVAENSNRTFWLNGKRSLLPLKTVPGTENLHKCCRKFRSFRSKQEKGHIPEGFKFFPKSFHRNEPYHKFPPILSGFQHKWQPS